MAKKHSTQAGRRLSNLKRRHQQLIHSLSERLSLHHDKLEELMACQQFVHQALLALTEPKRFEEFDDWHYGFFLYQRWLAQQANALSQELTLIKQELTPWPG